MLRFTWIETRLTPFISEPTISIGRRISSKQAMVLLCWDQKLVDRIWLPGGLP